MIDIQPEVLEKLLIALSCFGLGMVTAAVMMYIAGTDEVHVSTDPDAVIQMHHFGARALLVVPDAEDPSVYPDPEQVMIHAEA